MFNSSQDSPNSHNIMFDEMSESGKLHHALTHVCLENKAGISSQFKLNLDIGGSGNLLPVSVYQFSKTIDKTVQLLTATKSSITKLGTVHL